MTRRQLFALSPLAFAQSQTKPAPNIVLILADDLGYGDLACYGASDLQTPNIDALAQAGMLFTHFYANSPVCSPTRAALMTGCNPDTVGVPGVIRTHAEDSWGYLDPHAVLLPKRLKAQGYRTAMVGKWHLGLQSPNLPNDRGFDSFQGFLGDMMDDYRTHRRFGNNYMRRDGQEVDPQGHATDLFTEWAVGYLKQPRTHPLFLYVAYNAPHAPIQPPSEWLDRVQSRTPKLSEHRAKIVALIEHMDDGVGRIVQALKDEKMYDNTLLFFVSDNGGDLAAGATVGRLRGGKQDMYEGGIRVPAICVWPGVVKAGSQTDIVTQTSDLLPTLCDVAGAVKGEVDGISVLPTLHGQKQDLSGRTLFWVRREGGTRYNGQEYYAVRRGPWKLLHNTPFQPYELFNLDSDPEERHNAIQQEPKIARELIAALSLQIQRAGRVAWQAPSLQERPL